MAYSVKNIIVGAAALYVSKDDSTSATWISGAAPGTSGGPALPAGATTPSGATAAVALEADTTKWKGSGFTNDGIEVSYEPDYGEVQVDQLLDSAKIFKQGMRVSVNTTLVEATLENLLIAWGQQSGTLASGSLGIAAGGLGDEPVERSLAFVGQAPRTGAGAKQERVYHLRRALQVESSSHSLSRSDATVFPVSFRLLPDPAASGKEYGTITDRAVT